MSTSPSHNGKVIITCAIAGTGSIHTPSMSPYLPVTLGPDGMYFEYQIHNK
jgi:uncharacterized protein (DUF849 family)